MKLLRPSPRIFFISWEIQGLKRARNDSNSSPRFLSLSQSRLLGRVLRVERICVRSQIAGQRST